MVGNSNFAWIEQGKPIDLYKTTGATDGGYTDQTRRPLTLNGRSGPLSLQAQRRSVCGDLLR